MTTELLNVIQKYYYNDNDKEQRLKKAIAIRLLLRTRDNGYLTTRDEADKMLTEAWKEMKPFDAIPGNSTQVLTPPVFCWNSDHTTVSLHIASLEEYTDELLMRKAVEAASIADEARQAAAEYRRQASNSEAIDGLWPPGRHPITSLRNLAAKQLAVQVPQRDLEAHSLPCSDLGTFLSRSAPLLYNAARPHFPRPSSLVSIFEGCHYFRITDVIMFTPGGLTDKVVKLLVKEVSASYVSHYEDVWHGPYIFRTLPGVKDCTVFAKNGYCNNSSCIYNHQIPEIPDLELKTIYSTRDIQPQLPAGTQRGRPAKARLLPALTEDREFAAMLSREWPEGSGAPGQPVASAALRIKRLMAVMLYEEWKHTKYTMSLSTAGIKLKEKWRAHYPLPYPAANTLGGNLKQVLSTDRCFRITACTRQNNDTIIRLNLSVLRGDLPPPAPPPPPPAGSGRSTPPLVNDPLQPQTSMDAAYVSRQAAPAGDSDDESNIDDFASGGATARAVASAMLPAQARARRGGRGGTTGVSGRGGGRAATATAAATAARAAAAAAHPQSHSAMVRKSGYFEPGWRSVVLDKRNDITAAMMNHAKVCTAVAVRCLLDCEGELAVLVLACPLAGGYSPMVYILDFAPQLCAYDLDGISQGMLRDFLEAEAPLKLFHGARQDAVRLYRTLQVRTCHLLDAVVLHALVARPLEADTPPPPLTATLSVLLRHYRTLPSGFRDALLQDRDSYPNLWATTRPMPPQWTNHFVAESTGVLYLCDILYTRLTSAPLPDHAPQRVPAHLAALSRAFFEWGLCSSYIPLSSVGGLTAAALAAQANNLTIDGRRRGARPKITKDAEAVAMKLQIQEDHSAQLMRYAAHQEGDTSESEESVSGRSSNTLVGEEEEGGGEADEAGVQRQMRQLQQKDPDLATVLQVLPQRVVEALLQLLDSSPDLSPRDIVEIKADFQTEMKIRLVSGENRGLGIEADIREMLFALDAARVVLDNGYTTGELPPGFTPPEPQYTPQAHTPDPFVRTDNRLAFPGTLHRITAMRHGTDRRVINLTYRIGRAVEGAGEIFRDLLAGICRTHRRVGQNEGLGFRVDDPDDTIGQGSLLILGPPGCGKTTVLRDLARVASEVLLKNVVIVDTSNEIAGDGAKPHPCIGAARRMMVPQREQQHRVLLEALQNHTPEVIIIDEISDRKEVHAVRTIVHRGVKMIATAHGQTLRSLLKNPELNALVGGVREVTLGDAEARNSGGRKTRHVRGGAPAFSVLVEVLQRNRYRVHLDVASSVDDMLDGKIPHTQKRTFTNKGRTMVVEFPSAESMQYQVAEHMARPPTPQECDSAQVAASRWRQFLLDVVFMSGLQNSSS